MEESGVIVQVSQLLSTFRRRKQAQAQQQKYLPVAAEDQKGQR